MFGIVRETDKGHDVILTMLTIILDEEDGCEDQTPQSLGIRTRFGMSYSSFTTLL